MLEAEQQQDAFTVFAQHNTTSSAGTKNKPHEDEYERDYKGVYATFESSAVLPSTWRSVISFTHTINVAHSRQNLSLLGAGGQFTEYTSITGRGGTALIFSIYLCANT